ncbi:SAP30-binding protein [Toxocara canis]|uniref:SAP30-binding protein n=1 Tax=Toxocara canis TaxID=6265 RepID=A0A0B2VLW0_TOXCA|nr:SAP30-binding protein [Toxocara canis]
MLHIGGEVSTSKSAKQLAHAIRKNSDRWTASDEDREGSSHESASSSPRSESESSSVGEQPPPPKRFSPFPSERSVQSDMGSVSLKYSQSMGLMPITQSQTSLVSYGAHEEEEDDQFAKADKKAAAESKSRTSPPRSRSVTVEPKPPRGHEDSRSPDEIAVDSAVEEGLRELREHNVVTDKKAAAESKSRTSPPRSRSVTVEPKPPRGHEDSRSPDEIAVDSAVEEGLRELREHNVRGGESTSGSPNPSSVEGRESPFNPEEPTEVTLPMSPTEKCSRELELKFEKFFAKKAAGMDLNSSIQTRRDFKNPSIYERLIETFEVDELGSNFNPSVFDPHGFTEDCFYDVISVMQKEVMEKYTANVEKKSASGSADASKGNEAKRKSRFEGTKKH